MTPQKMDMEYLTEAFNDLAKIDVDALDYSLFGGLGEYLLCVTKLRDILGLTLDDRHTQKLFGYISSFLNNLYQNNLQASSEDEIGMLLSIGVVAARLGIRDKINLMNLIGNLLNGHFHNSLPLKSIYYPGLLALLFWKDEDNLFRYSCEEKILLLLRECEDLIEKSRCDKSVIPPGVMHSMLYFTQMCLGNSIGSFKAHILINKIAVLCGFPNTDHRLLEELILQDAQANIPNFKEDEIIGYMGLFSMLYTHFNPIFAEREHKICISPTKSPRQYLRIVGGRTLGLLTNIYVLSYK